MDSWDTLDIDASVDVPHDQEIGTFMWHLYKNKKFCDLLFELETPEGTVPFSAHRLVLALFSAKFEDMFYGKEKWNNLEIVPLKNIHRGAFGDMLGFMYGCDPKFDSIKKASELYKLAIDFEINSLSDFCMNFLAKIQVDATNVFDLLEIAKSTGDDKKVSKCMEVIRTKTRYIMSFYECSDITPAMVHIILNCRELAVKSEYELFNWLLVWAKNRYLECPQYSNMREVLEEYLPKLHFLHLTNEDFASICS